MAIEIKAPAFPESVADGEVAAWHKQEGESVARDELIVEIETDKVVMEVVAPEDGVITKSSCQEGETIESEQLLATLEPGAAAAAAQPRRSRRLRQRRSATDRRRLSWGPRPANWWTNTGWISARSAAPARAVVSPRKISSSS